MTFGLNFNSQILTTLIDDTGSPAVTYIGYAQPGNANNGSQPNWNIKRITDDGAGNIVVSFAGGVFKFDNIWDDRATLSYV